MKIFNTIKDKINDIKDGLNNIIYWFPIIWNDRYYDYVFFLRLVQHKLKQQSKMFRLNNICIDSIDISNKIDEIVKNIDIYLAMDGYGYEEYQELYNKILNEVENKEDIEFLYCKQEEVYNKIFDEIKTNCRNWWD